MSERFPAVAERKASPEKKPDADAHSHASGSGTDSMRSSESMSERFPPVHETEPTLPGRAIRFAAEMAFVDGWSQGGR